MRLADFILRDMETIVVQWEAFAGTLLPAAANMKSLALRDHAQQILQAVAKDLSTAQSREAQAEKSMGRAPVLIGAPETAAQTHALLRARGGFDINQLAAEYRALRASVLRLWMDECQPEAPDPDDVIRLQRGHRPGTCRIGRVFQRASRPGSQPLAWHARARYAQPTPDHPDDGPISGGAERWGAGIRSRIPFDQKRRSHCEPLLRRCT